MLTNRNRWVVLAAALVLCATPVVAQGPDDFTADAGAPSEGAIVTTIPAMTVPTIVFDFDTVAAGPTTAAALAMAFPGSALADITTTFDTPIGLYNFQTAGGRAIGGDAACTGLELVDPPAGAFCEFTDMTITFSEPVTEFGMEIGDWGGPFNAEFYDGGGLIEIETISTSGGAIEHFFASTTPFDSVVLNALPSTAANWVVAGLSIPEGTAVPPGEVLAIPTLGGIGLALLVGLLLLAGLVALRRRQTA